MYFKAQKRKNLPLKELCAFSIGSYSSQTILVILIDLDYSRDAIVSTRGYTLLKQSLINTITKKRTDKKAVCLQNSFMDKDFQRGYFLPTVS